MAAHAIAVMGLVVVFGLGCDDGITPDEMMTHEGLDDMEGEEMTPDPPPAAEPIEPGGDVARRTPAEWEPQASIWMQWPQAWEGAGTQAAFARIVEVIARYQRVDLIAHDRRTRDRGARALAGRVGDDVRWHVIPNDNAWMRDNGPRYVEVDGELVLQNWAFDAWGGGFGDDVPYALDDVLPDRVAALLNLPLEQVALVHERGDLEVNGVDTALVNWSVIAHRNPDLDRAAITAGLRDALGVESVIYAEGFDPLDGTRGHIDGMARFVSEDTVVVGDDGSALFDAVARQIREQRPDLTVERMVIEPWAPTMNWLVGNGFVLTGTSGDAAADARAAADLNRYFPARDVHFVDLGPLWDNGGGVHCVTNDQPAAP